ncbi:MAG: hypothetical protein VX527_10190 [Planctomycetota bacterium]|nr:hypothetical protein [Planctomycetota bacterium]
MRFLWLMTTCLLLTQTVLGVPTSRDTLTNFQDHQINPLVLPDDMRAYILVLGLDEAQQVIADTRYQAYITTLEEIVEASVQREKVLRKRLDGILQGRYRSEPGEIVSIRVQLIESKSANWPMADTQLDSLVEDILTVGPSVDSATLDRANFELHRRIYLAPLRLEAGDTTYAGEGLDFYELVEEASKAELNGVSPENMEVALAGWREALKASIRRNSEAERAAKLAEQVAILNGDTATRVNVMIERSKRWADRQAIDYNTFVAVYGLCPSTDAAITWTARYRQANYPWLWNPDDDVERIANWILKNGTPEQLEIVNEVLPKYLARREELRLETEGILSEGRRTGANLCDDAAMKYEAAEETLGQLMRNSGQRTVLMRQARAELEQPLTNGQRAAIARFLLGL